jgi:RNA polymerase sigma-70 factor, ECF subfamily
MTLLRSKSAVRENAPQASAFEELALPLISSLYNVAFWLSRNSSDAEDLVQETFLKALRGFATFEQGTNFKAWIFRILRNSFLTSRSGLEFTRTVSLEDEMADPDVSGAARHPGAAIDRETPETNLIRVGDRAAIEAAMENLPAPLLEIILLCDVEEMKYKDIAAILGIPMGTVMSRISRARLALRRELQGNSTRGREVGA